VSEETTAGRVLDVLAAAGVRTAFGLPGVHNLAFWHALREGRPTILGVRHEQTAGYAADGLARATGGLGVALTTTGPGAANTLAAFGEAAASRSAVVLVASDVPASLRTPGRPRGLLHESRDQGALFAPLAKAVLQPWTPDQAVAAAADAVTAALTAPRGPIYLGIPADVLGASAPPGPPLRLPSAAPPNLRAVETAVALLQRTDRVVIWAGGGAVAADAAAAVTDLAWRLGAPVVTTYAARGLLGVEHPLLVDAPPHEPEVAALIGGADLLLVVGSGLDGMATRNWTMPRPHLLIRVDVDERSATDGWPADVALVGDAALTCAALAVRIPQRAPWADEVYRIRGTIRQRLAADPRTAEAVGFLSALEAAWPADADVLCDMAVAGYWTGGYAAMPRPRRLQYPVGWGTLGYALPASIGAAAGTRRRALAVCGDGGAAYALAELAALVQERLPVCILVVDDQGYGMLRYDQVHAGHPERGVDLLGPDWMALAGAFRLASREVRSVGSDGGADLRSALSWAASYPGPTLLRLPGAFYPPRTTSPRWAEDASG
jgi:thiamine pyrophosphate-dependent acetolactate synthase large subunit-like protein